MAQKTNWFILLQLRCIRKTNDKNLPDCDDELFRLSRYHFTSTTMPAAAAANSRMPNAIDKWTAKSDKFTALGLSAKNNKGRLIDRPDNDRFRSNGLSADSPQTDQFPGSHHTCRIGPNR